MKKCPFCAEEIQDEAVKCRYCGEFLEGQKLPAKVVAEDVALVPQKKLITAQVIQPSPLGCLAAIPLGLFACFQIIFGLCFCVTIIGAIIGIPIMGGSAVTFAVIAAMMNTTAKGTCPNCSNACRPSVLADGFDCSACKKRILIRKPEGQKLHQMKTVNFELTDVI